VPFHKISGFHSGDYEEFRLLGCYAVWLLCGLLFLHNVCRLLVTANFVPSSLILVALMKVELSSSETSVLTRATRPNILEDVILPIPQNFGKKEFTKMFLLPVAVKMFKFCKFIENCRTFQRNCFNL
jgi:hypothetical protein